MIHDTLLEESWRSDRTMKKQDHNSHVFIYGHWWRLEIQLGQEGRGLHPELKVLLGNFIYVRIHQIRNDIVLSLLGSLHWYPSRWPEFKFHDFLDPRLLWKDTSFYEDHNIDSFYFPCPLPRLCLCKYVQMKHTHSVSLLPLTIHHIPHHLYTFPPETALTYTPIISLLGPAFLMEILQVLSKWIHNTNNWWCSNACHKLTEWFTSMICLWHP